VKHLSEINVLRKWYFNWRAKIF